MAELSPRAPFGRRARAALAVCVALAVLLVVSGSRPLGGAEQERRDAVRLMEPIVLALAQRGPGALTTPEAQWAYTALAEQAQHGVRRAGSAPLLPLLGAWSERSLGRVGLLAPGRAGRLPWLVLGALTVGLLYVRLRELVGGGGATLGAALLCLAPPYWEALCAGDLGVALALVTLGLWSPSGARARWRSGAAFAGGCAVGVGLPLALSPVVVAHLASRWSSARRLLRWGWVPLPPAARLELALAGALGCLLDPRCLSREATSVLRALLSGYDAAPSQASTPGAWWGWAPLLGVACVPALRLAWHLRSSGGGRLRRSERELLAMIGAGLLLPLLLRPALAPRLLGGAAGWAALLPWLALAAGLIARPPQGRIERSAGAPRDPRSRSSAAEAPPGRAAPREGAGPVGPG